MITQDKARRTAEEMLNDETFTAALDAIGESHYNTAPQYAVPGRKVRPLMVEAIAAALVKLTEGQEPVGEVAKGQDGWPWIRFSEYQTAEVARLPIGTKLYTHPIPSQQEEKHICCYGGTKSKKDCGDCAGGRPLAGQQEERVRELENEIERLNTVLLNREYAARNKEQGT